MEESPELKEIWDTAYMIYDTTMAQEESSMHKINEALANHKEVVICYVHRPYDKAARGMINRAIDSGRTVPADRLASDHYYAQRTFLSLCDRYERHENVEFILINNAGDLSEIEVVIDVDFREFLRHDLYVDLVNMKAEVRRIVDHEYWTRKGTDAEIPAYVYRAIIGDEAQSEG